MKKIFAILFVVSSLLSCKKESFRDTADFGYRYQPNIDNHWLEYQVDSIFFSDVAAETIIDTVSYFIREEFDTVYTDPSGLENRVVNVYKKSNEADAWTWIEQGSFYFSEQSFQRYFNDLRFINLSFPIRENRNWVGNAYLNVSNEPSLSYYDDDLYQWNYQYESINVPADVNGFSFDSTVSVIQIDEENLFEKKYATEIYAKDIGMIYKELLILNTQEPPSSLPFIERAETGFILIYKIYNY